MDIQPRTVFSDDGRNSRAWMEGFDDGSNSGLMCLECGALVLRRPDATELHRGWHRRVAVSDE